MAGFYNIPQEDVDALADILKRLNPVFSENPEPPVFNREEEFEKFFNYYTKENSLKEMSLHDICRVMWDAAWNKTGYGAKEIEMSDVERYVDAEQFIKDVQEMIAHPAKDFVVNKEDDGKVTLIIPCDAKMKEACIAWPDRCEDIGGNGDYCSIRVSLETLVGENPKVC